PTRDRRDVDDLAPPLAFHHRGNRIAEQKRAGEVEMEHPLPVVERELVHLGGRLRDDRAAADRIDQDVDATVLVDDPLDDARHLGGVERVGHETVCGAAGGADDADYLAEALLADPAPDDGPALSAEDLGGRPPDAAARGGDQRDSSLESLDRFSLLGLIRRLAS